MARNGADPAVAIIGGGIAGLCTAYYLGKAGIRADIFEAEAEAGGLARGFDFEGLRVDRYYHFLCLPDRHLINLAQELGLKDSLVFCHAQTNFFYEGKLYPFTYPLDLLNFSPISFSSRLKLGIQNLRWRSLREWELLDGISAKEWLISRLGEKAYQIIWHPLLAIKFGEYHDRISAAWLWHRIHRAANSRKSLFHRQMMGCFQGGTETLIQRLRERITESRGRIFLNSPVQKILRKSGQALSLQVSGADREYQSVVLAIPLPLASRILPRELDEYCNRLNQISFLGVICLILRLDQSLSPGFWCNINDSRIPFNGVIEMSRLNPETARGGALVYLPHYLPVNAPRFSFSDQEILQEFLAALPILKPGMDQSSIRSFRVFRSELAQPICTTGFQRLKPPHTTPWENLFLIDSTQLYPEDRTISGTIALAQKVSDLVLGRTLNQISR